MGSIFVSRAAICPEGGSLQRINVSSEGLANCTNPPKLVSTESICYVAQSPINDSQVAHSLAGVGWGCSGVGTNCRAGVGGGGREGLQGGRSGAGRAEDPQTARPESAVARPLGARSRGSRPRPPAPTPTPETDTYRMAFSRLSPMVRGRRPAAAPPAPRASSRRFESPAQPQSLRRAFAGRLLSASAADRLANRRRRCQETKSRLRPPRPLLLPLPRRRPPASPRARRRRGEGWGRWCGAWRARSLQIRAVKPGGLQGSQPVAFICYRGVVTRPTPPRVSPGSLMNSSWIDSRVDNGFFPQPSKLHLAYIIHD